MPEVAAIEVKDVEGSMLSDGGTHALVSLITTNDEKLALAVNHEALQGIINSFVDALAAFAIPKLDYSAPRLVISPNWFEVGSAEDGGSVVLTFRVPSGGSLSYAMDRMMASQLQEILASMLGAENSAPPPGTLRQ